MIYCRFTNEKSGSVIEVTADTQNGGRSKFVEILRRKSDAKSDRKVNTMRAEVAADGKWIEEAMKLGGLKMAPTGARLTVKATYYTPAAITREQYDAPNPFPGLRGY